MTLFAQAKAALAIEDLAARVTTLRGGQNDRRGACPLCGAGEKSASPPFRVRVGRQDFQCFACEQRGDVVDLYAALEKITPIEAAKRLAGPLPALSGWKKPERPESAADGDARDERIRRIAAALWSRSIALPADAAFGYLGETRGIDLEVIDAIDGLRFTHVAEHSWDGQRWMCAPALIAQAMTHAGWGGGVHATYLSRDLKAKAALEPAKRMWGRQGMDTPFGPRFGGAMLVGGDEDWDIVVAEGIETALSLASWLKRQGVWPLKVAAALSLNRLQGSLAHDEDGCVDVWAPKGEPGSPPFTWPAYSPGRRCFIGIDRDMSPIKLMGRTGRGRVTPFELSGEARAVLCARLARAAWLAAGWSSVTTLWPGVGQDWNDVIRSAA